MLDLSSIPLAPPNAFSILTIGLFFNYFVCRESLLNRTFRTPLALASRAVNSLEKRYNRPELSEEMRKSDGISTIIILILAAGIFGYILDLIFALTPYGWIIEGLIVGSLFTLRSLLDQMKVLADSLDRSTSEGRATLALISGRFTENYDTGAIARGGVENISRILTNGILAPAFYFWLGGLSGLLIFKIVNLSTNMIDERSHISSTFGWAPGHINRIIIWPAAILAAFTISICVFFLNPARFFKTLKMPFKYGNDYVIKWMGWPVAAMAGALNAKLGGPVPQEKETDNIPWVGDGNSSLDSNDIRKARTIFLLSSALLFVLTCSLFLLDIKAPADLISFFK